MNRQDAISKTNEMIDCQDGAIDFIKKEVERLLSVGAVDLDDYENNYKLPKVILITALRNCASQYLPPKDNKPLHKEIKNLSHY